MRSRYCRNGKAFWDSRSIRERTFQAHPSDRYHCLYRGERKRPCFEVYREPSCLRTKWGGFLDTDNFRKRVLHKLARDLKLPKLTFQVIRRTIATLAQKKGTVKDVQGLMRHSRTATTADVYMQEIPESVQSTVNSIHMELRQGPKKIHRKMATALSTGNGDGAIKSRRGPVHIKVFENLTPIDTKRSQREAALVR
jgi:integrase